jgi:mannose-6-phosphate isomerase-like protein (cupin superfamily)
LGCGGWFPPVYVKASDKTDCNRFARPTDEDEGIWLEHVEVHLLTDPAGQVKEKHVHHQQDHVIIVRPGRMRWTVEDQGLDTGPGDAFAMPTGTAHSYRVFGDEPARAVCVDSPVRRPTPR